MHASSKLKTPCQMQWEQQANLSTLLTNLYSSGGG